MKKNIFLWVLLPGIAGALFGAMFSLLDGGQGAIKMAVFGFIAGGAGGYFTAYFEDLPIKDRQEAGHFKDGIFGNIPDVDFLHNNEEDEE